MPIFKQRTVTEVTFRLRVLDSSGAGRIRGGCARSSQCGLLVAEERVEAIDAVATRRGAGPLDYAPGKLRPSLHEPI